MLNVCRDGRQHTPENLKYFSQNFIVFALLILDFFAWSAAATFHDSENNFSNSTREMPCFMASELSLSAHETDIGSEKQKLRVKLQFFSLPSVFFAETGNFCDTFHAATIFYTTFFPIITVACNESWQRWSTRRLTHGNHSESFSGVIH